MSTCLFTHSDLQLTYTAEFAQGKVNPREAGKQGGQVGGSAGGASSGGSGEDYKPIENDGLRKDGRPDGRVKGN